MSERKILQDDEDFLVEVIEWRGEEAVKKSIKPTTRAERVRRLKNEAYGIEFFTDLVKKHPEIKLYVPKLYEAGDGYIISEYINQPALGDSPENLDRLAKLLAAIDRIEPYGEA